MHPCPRGYTWFPSAFEQGNTAVSTRKILEGFCTGGCLSRSVLWDELRHSRTPERVAHVDT